MHGSHLGMSVVKFKGTNFRASLNTCIDIFIENQANDINKYSLKFLLIKLGTADLVCDCNEFWLLKVVKCIVISHFSVLNES